MTLPKNDKNLSINQLNKQLYYLLLRQNKLEEQITQLYSQIEKLLVNLPENQDDKN